MLPQEKENRPMSQDFLEIFPQIINQVSRTGDLEDMTSWKNAFPEIEFMETDDGFSGRDINWESRSLAEKAFYTAYMKDPQSVTLRYKMALAEGIESGVEQDTGLNFHLVVDRIRNKTITDSERIWWIWMSGATKVFDQLVDGTENIDNNIISKEALMTLFNYYLQFEFGDLGLEDKFIDMTRSQDLVLKSIQAQMER